MIRSTFLNWDCESFLSFVSLDIYVIIYLYFVVPIKKLLKLPDVNVVELNPANYTQYDVSTFSSFILYSQINYIIL